MKTSIFVILATAFFGASLCLHAGDALDEALQATDKAAASSFQKKLTAYRETQAKGGSPSPEKPGLSVDGRCRLFVLRCRSMQRELESFIRDAKYDEAKKQTASLSTPANYRSAVAHAAMLGFNLAQLSQDRHVMQAILQSKKIELSPEMLTVIKIATEQSLALGQVVTEQLALFRVPTAEVAFTPASEDQKLLEKL